MALDPAVGRLAQLANGHKYTGTHGELSAVLAHMTASSNMHVREYQQALGSLLGEFKGSPHAMLAALPLVMGSEASMEVPTADLSSNIAEAGIAAAASDDRWAFMVVLRALTADCQKASESGARGISDSAKALVILANGISPAASHYYPLQLLADLCNLHNILAIGLLATSSVVQAHNNQRRDAAVEVLRNLAAALNAAACRAMQSESAGPPSLRTNVSEDEGLMKVLRRFWLLTALLDAHSGGRGGTKQPWARSAVGWLACLTPELAPTMAREAALARIAAEMRPLLRVLGPSATQPALEGVLAGMLSCGPRAVPASKHPSTSGTALLVAVAAMHLARVEAAPVAAHATGVPFESLLRHLQTLPTSGGGHNSLCVVAEAAFDTYLDRVSVETSVSQNGEPESEAGQARLAIGLVDFLHPGLYASGPEVSKMAQSWLQTTLLRFPWLLWHVPLSQALAAQWESHLPKAGVSRRDCAENLLCQVAKQGAMRAPQWAAAVQTTALLAGGPGARLHRSAAVVAHLEAGATASQVTNGLGLLSEDASAGETRAGHLGRVRGLIGCARREGRASATVANGVLSDLQRAFSEDAAETELRNALLQAAAAVVELEGEQCSLPLVTALAWAPARQLSPECARLAAAAWLWVAVEAPGYTVDVVRQSLDALLYTAEHRLGMFSGASDGAQLQDSAAQGYEHVGAVSALIAHHTWSLFLLQAWRVGQTAPGQRWRETRAALQRGLLVVLQQWRHLSRHPAAAGSVFRLALVALEAAGDKNAAGSAGEHLTRELRSTTLQAALHYFAGPPAWYGKWSRSELREQAQAVSEFAAMAERTWGKGGGHSSAATVGLLQLLLQAEAGRLQGWADPTLAATSPPPPQPELTSPAWTSYATAAWQVDLELALALRQRFPGVPALTGALEDLVKQHAAEPGVQAIPEAATLLATGRAAAAQESQLQRLQAWAPAPLLQATALLAGESGSNDLVRQYALRSLSDASKPEEVAFFLPQLVQQLRGDRGDLVQNFLLDAAKRSMLFAHLLICALRTEGKPPEEAFNPAVKRSGWQPPRDTGLWDVTDRLQLRVWEVLDPAVADHLKAELDFFHEVTSVSGKLYEVDKLERKAKAAEILQDVRPLRDDLYLPVDPHARVLSVIPSSATPMQSAAKVPILVAFEVEKERPMDENPDGDSSGKADKREVHKWKTVQACIFKVGDDCRQDILALQVIGLLKEAFQKAGLDLYLAPYGVLPTSYECGIIEVVPNCASRSALGETSDGGLLEIFSRDFGPPGSAGFEKARHNFLRSEAGYAIACFLLQVKDRHNGNVMIDSVGHLVHIDFGFLLEISPGGNLGFESAGFKFSHEMTQLLDPSGQKASEEYARFEAHCIRGYLAARGVAEGIMATVELMAASGLPCFGRGRPVENLRRRFRLDLRDAEAAAFMQGCVRAAYDRWTTGFYDVVQYLQNNIPK
eukprot:CAMPEP_0206143372 /NCGR_PEP_ID=MMETSP1473-20131121/20292_1 /ASSEMBLY_ACC=CAM_ASM_001109 /TAXON_ID=1461547 /ORGANISM="Stichococcus sp, Strain RCC1054" /LENGTH=1452 /DNA_ID=CAMNT_0053538737 /DNA_START=218 /DNA_END=4576 /DNA_ORIENTATION=-